MTSGPPPPGIWDRIGISVSGLCMVHCMLLPVVLVAVPLWSTAETLHDWLHPLFFVALLPISFMALVATADKPQAKSVRVLLGVGLFVIVLASLFGHEEGGRILETAVTLLGSGMLVTGHWRNGQICRRCVHEDAGTTPIKAYDE